MNNVPVSYVQPSGHICGLPAKILLAIARYLEPKPEVNLNKAFSPLMNGPQSTPWTSLSQPRIDTSRPSIDDLKRAQPIWHANRDMMSFAATCKCIHTHTAHDLFRVAILFSGKQLAQFFLAIIQQPHRKQDVQVLQLHQFLFTNPQEKALRAELEKIQGSTGWDLLSIACQVFTAARYLRIKQRSPNVILSMALLHLLPKVSTLYMPYPRSLLTPRYHITDLNWAGPDRMRELEITIARGGDQALGAPRQTLALHAIQPKQLKNLQLNAVAHFQAFQYRGSGLSLTKDRGPLPYWTILSLNDAFQGLESLELQRIGDPLGMSRPPPPGLRFPCLKELKLHSLNINETGLLCMLAAVPALEILEVWFTMNRRADDESDRQQKLLDDNFEFFPSRLKKLSIAYLCDPVYSASVTSLHKVAWQPWTTTMMPRIRFNNLYRLENLERLGIDITSIVSSPPDLCERLAPLPPKLKHLRLFSVTSISKEELQTIPVGPRLQDDSEPIEWEYLTYQNLLEELKTSLHGRFADVKHRQLQHVELVRPLFLDEVVHRAKADAITRNLQGWSDKMINIAHEYETRVPREMQVSAQWLQDHCGFNVSLALDFADQMGGDEVTQRDVEVFWGRGQ